MDFATYKDIQPSKLNYKEIIVETEIEKYKKIHKMLYRSLSMMIHDISFLYATTEFDFFELDSDWISINILHTDIFENLITRMYRVFFDNSGNEACSLVGFKCSLIGKMIKDEYKEQILNDIRQLPIESKTYKKKSKKIQDNVIKLRHQYIAHGLISSTDSASVKLVDLKELLEYGCELFQTLSFNVKDFYIGTSDGYGFEAEWKFTYKSSRAFIKYCQLSSTYISDIYCEYNEYCPKEVQDRLNEIIQELNTSKKRCI